MKKILTLALFPISILFLNAQNIQLHYDFGHSQYNELNEQSKLTSTV